MLLERSLIEKQAIARNRSLREREMSKLQTMENSYDKLKNALFWGEKSRKFFFSKE